MKCPHCLVEFFPEFSENLMKGDANGSWYYSITSCPSCLKFIIDIHLINPGFRASPSLNPGIIIKSIRAFPRGTSRPPCPIEVDSKFKVDYEEACLTLPDSPKASAALSRRCLQLLLRDKVGVKKGSLNQEVDEAIKKENYPSSISELLHGLQWVGNFAAHPEKDTMSGTIIDTEPGEAELCLEILEALFDYHFVLPEKNKVRLAKINKKLTDAGKPPI
jgi:hypothetical protein